MIALDLIFYLIIAVGLVLWLRNVLGTRHGSERDRGNPFTAAAAEAAKAATEEDNGLVRRVPPGPSSLNPIRNAVEKAGEAGLAAIQAADPRFDLAHFLHGAEALFPMIVEAFAKGDRQVLKKFLAPSVYYDFEREILSREARGETQTTDVHAVRRADIVEARLEGQRSIVAVRFVADETSTTKNKEGTLIVGDPDKVIEMVDVWVFMRDTRISDPTWQVVETREDRPEPAGAVPLPSSLRV